MFVHKTVLVSCHIIDSPQAIPLATSILKTYQPYKDEVEIILKDFYLIESPLEAAETILKLKPDSVGFSMYIWNRDFFVQTAQIIKNKHIDIVIYAGGAEITASAFSLIDDTNFDYLIRGEGELPFVQLLDYLIGEKTDRPNKLLTMSYLDNLGLIPSPFLNHTLDPALWKGLLWELSRGCPYNCSFCSESRGVKGVRYYNEERIKNELILFEEKKVEQVFVLDPTFNIDKNRAMNFLSLIRKIAPDIHFTFEIRAELLDEELAERFALLHCSLQIGLQSYHKDVLRNVNRTINQNQFSEKINLLNKHGAVFGLDLIYGLPGDSIGGFMTSLDYALKQIPNHLDIFRLSVFPGTVLYEKANSFNLVFEKSAPYSVISSPQYSKTDLDKSEETARAVDLFYNKGKTAGWFLSVVDVLNITPSKFFIEFTSFLAIHYPDPGTPYISQNQFLKYIFRQRKKEKYLPVALDLCKFHYLYSETLYAELDQENDANTINFNLEQNFIRNSILRLGSFNFDVSLYAQQGMIDIKYFVKNNYPEKSYALIFNNGYEIETIPIEKKLYLAAKKMTGEQSLAEILRSVEAKQDEADEFINFLIELSLISPAQK